MTQLEQTFFQTTPTHIVGIEVELVRLNENMSKLITLLENRRPPVMDILQDSLLQDTSITASEAAAELLREELQNLDHEEFWLVLLGNDLKPYRKMMVCSGTLTASPIDYRRVVKEALNSRATSVIIYHNHPSENLEPSKADIEATEKLRDALKIFDLTLVDHIIIGRKGYFSFADAEIRKYRTK